MTTSGTTAFNLDVMALIEHAYTKAGRTFRSGYDFESARRALDLLLIEWANQGVNLWTVQNTVRPLTIGVGSYALPADTVDVLDVALVDNSRDFLLERIGQNAYAGISDKLLRGRPQQFYVERTATPTLRIWPTPQKVYSLTYWRMRRIQDAGSALNTIDAPARFLPALTAGLALALARLSPQLDQARIAVLSEEARQSLMLAQMEDRERGSFYLRPSRAF